VWGRIPPRNINFTGREELLDRLHGIIGDKVTAVLPEDLLGIGTGPETRGAGIPRALQGIGGVGKTQLAIEYAYRYRSEYEVIWWISADQPVLVRSSLAALGPALGLSTGASGIEDAAEAVLSALRRGVPYDKWLLIFDNADQPEDIRAVMPEGPGHVLITSRNHAWRGVVDIVSVDVFSRAESIAFLAKRVSKKLGEDEARRLAEALGDLPLALEQAGALLAETGMAADEYLHLLDGQTRLLLSEGKPNEYPVSMTAAWSLSVTQLRGKLPEAVELLRCCAFFGPEPIPRDVFIPIRALDDDNPLNFEPQLAELLANPIRLSRAIKEMARFALAKVDVDTRTLQVHRLVQALLREEMTADGQEQVRHEVHLLLAAATNKDPENPKNWPDYTEVLAHVEPSRVVECRSSTVRRFCLDVARYLYISGNYQEAKRHLERVLADWAPALGPDHFDVLVARRHLGTVLRELGDREAAYELNTENLRRMEDVLGPDHEEVLALINSYGGDLRTLGEFSAALEHDRASVQRHERVFGPNHRLTLRAKGNLAIDYGLVSDYDAALEVQMTSFEFYRRPDFEVSPHDVLLTWGNLARTVRLMGEFIQGTDVGDDAVAYGKSELGADNPFTLRAAKDLSIALRRAGRVNEGLEMAEDTYHRELRILGPDHPESLAAAMNYANALRTLDRVTEGYEIAEETTRRYPALYGPDHPYNHGCAINLALLLRVQGDLERALEMDLAALAALEARLGFQHHYTLSCAMNTASDLAVLGRFREARELGERALRAVRAVQPRTSAEPGMCRQPRAGPAGGGHDGRRGPALPGGAGDL
jgi:tetratricopeptide (TPR) repeat protein